MPDPVPLGMRPRRYRHLLVMSLDRRYPLGDGKMRMVRLGKERDVTLSDARGQAYIMRREFLSGNEPALTSSKHANAPLLKDFLFDRYIPSIKPRRRSWHLDEATMRHHFVPRFGARRMDSITHVEMEAHLADLINQGYKAISVNRYLIAIKTAFNMAVRWKVISEQKNPCSQLKMFPEVPRPERFLSQSEAMKLLETLDRSRNWRVAKAIKLILLTGARKREILDARWEYINREARVLSLPTSKSGRPRHIALSDAALALIDELPRAEGVPWLFFNPRLKQPLNNLHPTWVNLRNAAGLRDLRIHDLRHSFASFLVNHGRSLYEVQGLLGHQNPRTTMRYAHLSSSRMVDAANLVGAIVGGGR